MSLCSDRVVVVTGGGRGLGRAHVLALAAHGACVVVNDLGAERDGTGRSVDVAEQVAEEVRASGGRAIASTHDITDWDQAGELIQLAVDTFGRLDVLVNNAGILRDRMLVNMSPDEWDSVIAVHLRGTFATTRHAATHWRERAKSGEQPDARLINTTSPSGLYGKPGQANYGAAKAGIASLTLIAAAELGRYGVTANAVAPVAYTRMTADLVTAPDAATALAPEHVSPIVCWLASSESGHVTGRVFETSGRRFGIAEGWRHGPFLVPEGVLDPTTLGPVVDDLLAQAEPLSAMGGNL